MAVNNDCKSTKLKTAIYFAGLVLRSMAVVLLNPVVLEPVALLVKFNLIQFNSIQIDKVHNFLADAKCVGCIWQVLQTWCLLQDTTLYQGFCLSLVEALVNPSFRYATRYLLRF